jgi:hypothetical protein
MSHLIPVFFLPVDPKLRWIGADPETEAQELLSEAAGDERVGLFQSLSTNWWHLRAIEGLIEASGVAHPLFLREVVAILPPRTVAEFGSMLDRVFAYVLAENRGGSVDGGGEPVVPIPELRERLARARDVPVADEAEGIVESLAECLVSMRAMARAAAAKGNRILYYQPQP